MTTTEADKAQPVEDIARPTQDSAPPYISYRTFAKLIEGLEDEAVPPRIDRSFLRSMSGGYQTQVLAALRSLGFIDSDGKVLMPLLSYIRGTPEQRHDLMRSVVESSYAEAVELGRENATQGQLEECFATYGVSGSTKRKAIAFFLKAAEEAGIEVSPHFRVPRATPTPRRVKRITPHPPNDEEAGDVTEAAENGGLAENFIDKLRARYVETLMHRIETSEELDEALLDRIEAILGLAEVEEDQ